MLALAPDHGTILCTDSAEPGALGALVTLASREARRAPRPLALVVLGWSPEGWQVVPPAGATTT